MKKKMQYIAPRTEVIRVQVDSLMGFTTSPGGNAIGTVSTSDFDSDEDWASREYDEWD